MTHKTNPIAYRLGISTQWHSRYFSEKNLKTFLEEDMLIRSLIEKKHKRSGIEKVDIERNGNVVRVFIHTARPGLIIGRGGSGVDDMRNILTKAIHVFRTKKKYSQDFVLQFNIEEVRRPEISAYIVSENIALSLEKRMPFRRVIKGALEKVMSYKEVKGAKMYVAGRLNGAEIARTEWVSDGKLPLVTLRSDIDYAENRAYCTYGTLGVKVWIYKGELVPGKE